MKEIPSLDEQKLMEETYVPDYEDGEEDRLMELFGEYEKNIPLYDKYTGVVPGLPVHASTRLSQEIFEYILNSGETASQWIREACETRYEKETGE